MRTCPRAPTKTEIADNCFMNWGQWMTLGNITRLDLPTNTVLEAAKGHCSDGVVVLGFDNNGDSYFASSIADGGSAIWLLEVANRQLIEIEDDY